MGKNHGIFLLAIGTVIVLLSLFIFFHDPIIGGAGLLIGSWNVYIGIRLIKGKWLFGSKFNDPDD